MFASIPATLNNVVTHLKERFTWHNVKEISLLVLPSLSVKQRKKTRDR